MLFSFHTNIAREKWFKILITFLNRDHFRLTRSFVPSSSSSALLGSVGTLKSIYSFEHEKNKKHHLIIYNLKAVFLSRYNKYSAIKLNKKEQQ